MEKTWKGKSSDVYLVVLYFSLYTLVIHILVAIRHSLRYNEDILRSIQDPFNFLFTFGLLFFFMSPVWIYFRKVPKSLTISSIERRLEIKKKNRILNYNMDKIRFYKRKTTFFYILEIHATFESSRRAPFEKLATSIIVPNWGLSWNRTKMEEIIEELKEMKVPEIEFRPYVSINEYLFN